MGLFENAFSIGENALNAETLRRIYLDQAAKYRAASNSAENAMPSMNLRSLPASRSRQSSSRQPSTPRLSDEEKSKILRQFYPTTETMDWSNVRATRAMNAENQRQMFANSDAAAMGQPLPYPNNPYAAETAAAATSGKTQLTAAGRAMANPRQSPYAQSLAEIFSR